MATFITIFKLLFTSRTQLPTAQNPLPSAKQPLLSPTTATVQTATPTRWNQYANSLFGYTIEFPDNYHLISPLGDHSRDVFITNYDDQTLTPEQVKGQAWPGMVKLEIVILPLDKAPGVPWEEWLIGNPIHDSDQTPTSTVVPTEISGYSAVTLLSQQRETTIKTLLVSKNTRVLQIDARVSPPATIDQADRILATLKLH